ncbi:MAG TPA: ATP-binding protein [Thermodesulfobacteriota bacterium]|nr:ATP-binding protein [Thermodesulfobacteriota bacterium]
MKTQGKILVISGNPELQDACRQALEPVFFPVQITDSLHDGIETATEGKIDVVLLDGEIFHSQRDVLLLEKLWEKDADLACLLLSKRDSMNRSLQPFQAQICDRVPVPLVPEHFSLRGPQALEQRIHSLELNKGQMENLKKTVEWVLEQRIHSLELKRLHAFVQNVAPLWSVAAGEMDTSDLFDKDFLAPAAFRLTIAHEFRAPLTALQSYLLILLKEYVAPEKWKEILQHAFDRSQDMLDLVDDLMNLAAAQHEMSLENRSLVRLGDELGKLAPSFKTETDERRVALTLTALQNPFVRVNPHHVGQLWTNLISNAIKYTPAGGSVKVSLGQDKAWAIGAVEDSGIGISPRELPLIFHEFYRTAEAKNMGVRGTGLGLPLVKRIVEGYGGSLEVKSEVGKGSLFRFTLPLAAPPSSQAPNGE